MVEQEIEININEHLTLLQQTIDPTIRSILSFVKFVALYEFDPAPKLWHKKRTEGALYVVDRHADPVYQIVILNRRAAEDFKYNLRPTVSVKKAESIWSFKDEEHGTIYGIWSSFQSHLDASFEKIQELINTPILNPEILLSQRMPISVPGAQLSSLATDIANRPVVRPGFSKVVLEEKPVNKMHKVREILLKLANDQDFLDYIAKFMP